MPKKYPLPIPSLLQQKKERKAETGFTLVELTIVIVIIGILAALGGRFIAMPVESYVDLARRTRLVDQAAMALQRMQRDIRHALPNSIRIGGGGRYLEMLNTIDGGRYRLYPDPVNGGDVLDFSSADDGFDVLGQLSQTPADTTYLVVYNVASSGSNGNAYDGDSGNRATIGTGSNLHHIVLDPAHLFTLASPYQRFFIVDQPLTYACEGGQLNRYSGYTISTTQSTSLSNPALVTRNVAGCTFSYDPGTSQHAGLVTLELSLAEEGETITLLHQIHVDNTP